MLGISISKHSCPIVKMAHSPTKNETKNGTKKMPFFCPYCFDLLLGVLFLRSSVRLFWAESGGVWIWARRS